MRFIFIFLLVFPLAIFAGDIDKVNFYSNATSDEISINIGERNHAIMVQVLTQSGEVIWTEHHKESAFKLNLRYYPKGVYTIRISVQDKVETYQFVKK